MVNHKRVQRLMSRLELKGKRPKEKYHSYKGDVGRIADNLINRDFSTKAPLEKWTTDVSQFSFSWGKCYLSPILDMNTNEIISYDLSLSPNLEQVKKMLDKAFRAFPDVRGLILHSDQGSTYCSEEYQQAIERAEMICSMSRKGNCWDNAPMESFWGTLKNESLSHYRFNNRDEAISVIREYIEIFYNRQRRHSRLGNISPAAFREKYHQMAA